MSKMRLTSEMAITARVLARSLDDERERKAARAKARAWPRLDDAEAGFLKSRTAAFLKNIVLNCDAGMANGKDEFGALLSATANFLLLLPDENPPAPQPRGFYARPVREREDGPEK